MKTIRMFTGALAAFAISLTALAGDPTGTWTFKADGAQGRSVESVLKLTWVNNQLAGTIDNRAGEAPITRATFANDQLSFAVERKIRRRAFTTHYTGKLEGDTIKGTIQVGGRKKSSSEIPWVAERVK